VSADAATPFQIPTLPSLAAVRDRHEEAAMRARRQREDGWVAGYEDGLTAARSEIEREIADHRRAAERLTAAALAVEAAVRDLAAREAASMRELEQDAVALAVELAVELVGRELAATAAPALDAARRAAALMPDRGVALLRVHPDDEATVSEAVAHDVLTWPAGSSVVADRTIERGGCVVEVGACRIDAQLRTAIERMRDALDRS
jgi:flagellar biosynthesis/type III secretory pathway protein FliH